MNLAAGVRGCRRPPQPLRPFLQQVYPGRQQNRF